MLGGHFCHRIEPKLVEVHDARLRAAIVGLVDGDQRRLAGGTNRLGDVVIPRHQPLPSIDDEDEQVGGFNRAAAPLEDERVKRILAGTEHPAGIDHFERHATPFSLLRDDVARGTCNRRHDRAPGAGDSVEQRGLADVGTSNENDGGEGSRHQVWVRPRGRPLQGSRTRVGAERRAAPRLNLIRWDRRTRCARCGRRAA
jgi:hypothetical protein